MWWLTHLLIGVVVSSGQVSADQDASKRSTPFHVDGALFYRGFDDAGSVVADQHWSYGAEILDSRWVITLTYPPFDTQAVPRTVVATDGTNTYQLALRNRSTATNYVPGSAVVRTNVVPYPDDAMVAPIWLALASARYLDTTDPPRLKPVWFVPEEAVWNDSRCRFDCTVARASKEPYLPTEIVFRNAGHLLAYDEKSQSVEEHSYPEPFNSGFTQAVYRADGFQDFGSIHLPTRFTLEVFRPAPPGRLITYLRFVGAISNVWPLSGSSGVSVPPQITTRTVVYDHRVMIDSGSDGTLLPVKYLATNQWLVATSDPRFQRVVNDNIKLQGLIRSRRFSWPVPKLLALAALLALAFAPTVLWFRRRHMAGHGEEKS